MPEPSQVSEDTGPQTPLPTALCWACSAPLASLGFLWICVLFIPDP